MPLRIKPSTSEERELLFIEALLNKTNKVSKVSDHSVLRGISAGNSKVSGKAEKDIILALSKMFPDSAFGVQLDDIADNWGIADRFTTSKSSTYIRIFADPGTQYLKNTHIFKSSKEGVDFELDQDVTVGNFGFIYAKVRSIDSGSDQNVPPASIDTVAPEPSGHQDVVNEYKAVGGRDLEQDDLFRSRIKEGPNVLAKDTISMIEQVFMLFNEDILRVFFQGFNDKGQVRIAIATHNGIDLSNSELDDLLEKSEKYFSIVEQRPIGTQSFGLELKNIEWQPLDLSFRIRLFQNVDPDDFRRRVQVNISKYLDFREWKPGEQNIEWDDLLSIVKNTNGAKYVPDRYFSPNVDIPTDKNKLPRLRGFKMLNLDGDIIADLQGNLNPVFYESPADFSFQQTVLNEQ